MKALFKLTTEDYFSYVGTSPNYSTKRRVIDSLPMELDKGQIIKYKKLNIHRHSKWYRVHVIADITTEQYERMLRDNTQNMKKFENFSYKLIK